MKHSNTHLKLTITNKLSTMTTATFNRLTMKALMIDTITFLKFGKHMHPGYKVAKNTLCDMAGQKRTINARQLLTLIGMTYEDNGLADEFWATIDKFDAEQYVQQG